MPRNAHLLAQSKSVKDQSPITVFYALLDRMGNSASATATTAILADLEPIQCVIMVGIAGGIPGRINSSTDIRLGDLIFPKAPIIQYDFKSIITGGGEKLKSDVNRAPCGACKRVAHSLMKGNSISYWDRIMKGVIKKHSAYARPKECKDPKNDERKEALNYNTCRVNLPRVLSGKIGSANILLKDDDERERIRKKYDVMAVEMESAGVAEATGFVTDSNGVHRKQYFVVRGISDYCDGTKTDTEMWRKYAALNLSPSTMPCLKKWATTRRQ